MQSTICRYLFFGVVVMMFSCTGGKTPLVKGDGAVHDSSGITAVRSYAEIEKRILSLSGDLFKVEIVQTGACSYGPCDIFRIIFNENNPNAKSVLLVGAIHGDEPAGAEALLRLLETINNKPDNYANFTITIVPVLNPWGWEHNQRANAQGVDLNNDFGLFQTPEIRAFAYHPADKRYDLVIDLHEAGQAAHFIYCYGDNTQDTCRVFSSTFKQKGYVLDSTYQDVLSGTKDGVMSVPLWIVNFSRLSDSIALTHYFYLKGSAVVVTSESSKTFDFESRVMFHMDVICFFLSRNV